jgi:hypothetical protein
MSTIPNYAIHTTYEALVREAKEVKRTSFFEATRLEKLQLSERNEMDNLLGLPDQHKLTRSWCDTIYHDRALEDIIKWAKDTGGGVVHRLAVPILLMSCRKLLQRYHSI